MIIVRKSPMHSVWNTRTCN